MGNTKVIDLGYVDRAYMTITNGTAHTYDLPTLHAYMSDTRQRMIDAGLNDGISWSLSRTCKHLTAFDSGYRSGWFFWVLKRLVAGVASGEEWLIGIPGFASYTATGVENLGANISVYNTYFYGNSNYGFGNNGSYLLDYNPNGLLSTYAIGAGAEFDPPATSPKTNLPGFMPSGVKVRGTTGYDFSPSLENQLALVVNHSAKVVGFVQSERYGSPRGFSYAGEILNPKRSTDAYSFGVVQGASSYNSPMTSARVNTVTHAGVDVNCAPYGHTGFLAENQPYFDGTDYRFHRDSALVYSASYIKGELKPDLFPVQGGLSTHYLRMFASEHGRALKINDRMCIPWADNVPPPFSGWPINPKIPTTGG